MIRPGISARESLGSGCPEDRSLDVPPNAGSRLADAWRVVRCAGLGRWRDAPGWVWAVLGACAVLAVYGASMGSTGAWDPWETHYGEVARNILVRSDPLDLYWKPGNGGPQGSAEGPFWSKPALPFWCMALSMKLFGVGLTEDPAEMVRGFWPELALRLPSMVIGLGSAVVLGVAVARLSASRRAGMITTLVLLSMPQWAIVTRQAVTDMFFVGPVIVAMVAWMLAWLEPDRELRTRGNGLRRVPWDRAYAVWLIAFVVAAVVPLLVLHLHVVDDATIERVADLGRRKGKPNPALLARIFWHLWLYWALAAVVLAGSLRWRRRSQALMGLVYLAGGASLIGKGLIGPGLIGLLCLAHIVVTARFRLLARVGLPLGVLMFALVGFPWHHGQILFRGEGFVYEWIFIDNLKRFGTGEQDQAVGSFAFYLRTLGLAAAPWIAVVPLSLWAAFRAHATGGAGQASPAVGLHRFALLWFVVSLWAITFSVTKYYHYLLPCLPPLSLLVGLWLDGLLRGRSMTPVAGAVGGLFGVAVLAMALRDALYEPAWIAHLTTYLYTGMWRTGAPSVERLAWACGPFLLGLVLMLTRRPRAAVTAMALSALLTTVYIVDDYLPAASESWSQRSMFRKYFAERGPNDRLVSWWFYYRGETYFSKRDVWVMKEPDRDVIRELIGSYEGKQVSLWFMTTVGYARRLPYQIPQNRRDDLERVYESFHYVMFRLPVR